MGRTHNSDEAMGKRLHRRIAALHGARPPRTVLVIITRRIGDVLLTTPLIHTLKSAWPDANIDVLVLKNTRDILSHHPDIHRVIFKPDHASKLATLKWLLSLWNKYDLALSALPSDRATLYAWLAGKFRIGLLEDQRQQRWKKLLLNDWVAFDDIHTHTVSMVLKLASRLGLALQPEVTVTWAEQDSHAVDELLAAHALKPGQPYAVLHVYPKFSYKMWHTSGWVALVAWLNQHKIPAVFTGSGEPDEMNYIQQLLGHMPADTINLAGKLNFAQMAYLLKKAKLYVGPDTVTTHLAAAMGTPTVALFGPSNPVKWGPWPQGYHPTQSPWQMAAPMQKVANVVVLQGLEDCVPCRLEGCDRHINSRSQCLDNMGIDRVTAAINELLSC